MTNNITENGTLFSLMAIGGSLMPIGVHAQKEALRMRSGNVLIKARRLKVMF